ncbi:MAG: response regulator [Deltaproteobacteria bacterium]|nr:response regulator [Deltaproteobacteria bacterium]
MHCSVRSGGRVFMLASAEVLHYPMFQYGLVSGRRRSMSTRILIIDDDQQILVLLRRTFETGGYSVDEAPDGRAGFAVYTAEPHDLVIADLIMPEREGLETIRDLRRFNPAVKIIALSGGGSLPVNTCLRMAECFGAQRVLNNPSQVEDIPSAVRQLLPWQAVEKRPPSVAGLLRRTGPSAALCSSFVTAAYGKVRLIPHDFARLASGHF